MNSLVLDANVAVDWFCPSAEGDAYSLPLLALQADGVVRFQTPLHFDVEVARVLRKYHKRDRQIFSANWFSSCLQMLDLLELESVALGVNFTLLGQLSHAYNLDIPDVPYLHTARQLGVPLATRDAGLISACKAWNVEHWTPGVTAS